jgi:UDP-N-acetylglucosamine 4,6-dehydratase
MISEDDSRHTIEFDDYYIIQPDFVWWSKKQSLLKRGGKQCDDGFSYNSATNTQWLTVEELKQTVNDFCEEYPEYK